MPFQRDPLLTPSIVRMWGLYKAKCSECGWEKQFQFSNGMGLQIGDPLPSGNDNDPNFDVCLRCKRKALKLSATPPPPQPAPPVGFWKLPTE